MSSENIYSRCLGVTVLYYGGGWRMLPIFLYIGLTGYVPGLSPGERWFEDRINLSVQTFER